MDANVDGDGDLDVLNYDADAEREEEEDAESFPQQAMATIETAQAEHGWNYQSKFGRLFGGTVSKWE